ncbi:hypothetical protein LEMLEM_LOCUS21855 [Lemmus lemmus]
MTFTQHRDTSSGLQLTLNVPHGETLQIAAPAEELQGSSGSRSRWPSATAAGPPWHTCARRPPHTPAHTPARANEPTALHGGREPVVGRGSRGHTALALLPPARQEQASGQDLPEFREPEAQKKENFKDSLTGTSGSGIHM